ncbi:MAG: hypothetical protein J1E62_00785 [Lachnospiraceae bacterium]|nr:hypothetical protein [Lachnospiraceae bacterium]
MGNIVVSGNGVPTAANSRTASGIGTQSRTSAVNQKASDAYNAWRTVTSNQSAAVSVDIPEGAMRVSREIQEEYGQYPGAQSVYTGEILEEVNPEEVPVGEESSKGKKEYGITEEGLNNLERLLEEMKESREANKKSNEATKKRLHYNYRRISSSISRAKNVNQASNALTTATSNLNSLRRKMATGKYNDNEVQIAINHAKRMVRVARKKVKHIKWEMQVDKQDTHVENDKERRNRQELIAQPQYQPGEKQEKEQELLLLKKQLNKLRVQRKNANRRNEDHDLIIADMEYLKAKLDMLRQEQQESRSDAMKTIAAESSEPAAAEVAATVNPQVGGTAEAPSAAEVAGAAVEAGAAASPNVVS